VVLQTLDAGGRFRHGKRLRRELGRAMVMIGGVGGILCGTRDARC
jgi:hypothetical protein